MFSKAGKFYGEDKQRQEDETLEHCLLPPPTLLSRDDKERRDETKQGGELVFSRGVDPQSPGTTTFLHWINYPLHK
jgi:hypothetical protein